MLNPSFRTSGCESYCYHHLILSRNISRRTVWAGGCVSESLPGLGSDLWTRSWYVTWSVFVYWNVFALTNFKGHRGCFIRIIIIQGHSLFILDDKKCLRHRITNFICVSIWEWWKRWVVRGWLHGVIAPKISSLIIATSRKWCSSTQEIPVWHSGFPQFISFPIWCITQEFHIPGRCVHVIKAKRKIMT